ncbi:hypothetical protein [Aliiroseovarius sp. F47248L]|uniref:hypothetical protein n=1 Tax=Aliiroseovarius sp. F47248L TaxID=2926420 RepID=UPI001FF1C345|nr:hypothetical protein [Aliiroseovarius sp. F47248L]MCK0139268.1 hypothetical protein [Aliiroseovarius sp. F47248L]
MPPYRIEQVKAWVIRLKNYVILALACALALSLSGFKPILQAYNSSVRHGTLSGVVKCVELSSSDLISSEATKKVCASKHEVDIRPVDLNGRGGPRKDKLDVTMVASLQNKHQDTIFTWVELKLGVKDEIGTESFYSAQSRIWVEPDTTYEFKAILEGLKPEDFGEMPHCNDASEQNSCWSWGVALARGVIVK